MAKQTNRTNVKIEQAPEPKLEAAEVKDGNVVKAVDPTKPGGKAKALTEKEQAAALVQSLNPGKPDLLRCLGVAVKHNTRV